MSDVYKLEVDLTPHTWDNKYKPYSWCLLKWCEHEGEGTWCNYGFGWAETPQKAWEEGYGFYERYKM